MPDHTILFDLPLKKKRGKEKYINCKQKCGEFLKFYHTTNIQGQDYI